MLELRQVTARYGRVQVLHGVDLQVAEGEIVGLLGRNGAGKTSTIRAIMGLVDARHGAIRVDGTDISALAAHRVPRHGVAYVPQGRRLFPHMTVEENLRMGARLCAAGEDDRLAAVLDMFPALRERLRSPARTLSGGQQQMVAMGRALASAPRVLLLDEPTEGLMPSMVARILETIDGLRGSGVAVLLVEQKVEAALQVADRVSFIENGRIAAEHPSADLRDDPRPLVRYVGVRR